MSDLWYRNCDQFHSEFDPTELETWGRPMRFAAFSSVLLLFFFSTSPAEEYRIGPEDVLQISVWQHPELDARVRVSASGRITFSPVGEMEVQGLTTSELSKRLAERLRIYTRELCQVTVTVVEFNSKKVYVLGQVANPGAYSFERIPGLWEVLRRAGGPTEDASLSNVKLVTKVGSVGTTMIVDLQRAIQEGRLDQLPALKPGDTVIVPRKTVQEQVSQLKISVMGAVARPGMYEVPGSIRLTEALMLAGGPTERALLKKVKLIKSAGGRSYSVLVNYQDYLKKGVTSQNPLVDPGDEVFVPSRSFSWGITTNRISTVLQISATIVNFYLLYRVIEMGRVPYPRFP